jgi:Tfp pilus assembly protein PilV
MNGRILLRRSAAGFALVEVLVAFSIITIGFLGTYGLVLQSGKLASAAEEDAFVCSGVEQRIDQLRELTWPELTSAATDGTGVTKVWAARPATMAGITVSQETLNISATYDLPPYDAATPKLQATWDGTSSPVAAFSAGGRTILSAASAVKVIATLTWTGRRSSRQQTRSIVTVISKGGISRSDLP